jgi:hypothetical protein
MTKPFSIIRVFKKFPAPALSFKIKVSTEIKQNRSGLNGYEDYTIAQGPLLAELIAWIIHLL